VLALCEKLSLFEGLEDDVDLFLAELAVGRLVKYGILFTAGRD